MNSIATVTKRKSHEYADDELLLKIVKNFSTEDVKHVEDLYKTVLDIKSKLNAVYEEGSLKLRKSIESIQSIVPEKPQSQSTTSSTAPTGSVAKKWMLKHPEPGPGLIELMPDTGIYVEEMELKQTKLKAPDMRKFARALLSVVFSKEALRKCSYTGLCQRKRPGLDEYARTVFIAFVTQHAKESGWEIVSKKQMTYAMTSKVNDLNNHFYIPNSKRDLTSSNKESNQGSLEVRAEGNKAYVKCQGCGLGQGVDLFLRNGRYEVKLKDGSFLPLPAKVSVDCDCCSKITGVILVS